MALNINLTFGLKTLSLTILYIPPMDMAKLNATPDSQPTQSPMEIPTETVVGGFIDQDPHEARIRKHDQKCKSIEQTARLDREERATPMKNETKLKNILKPDLTQIENDLLFWLFRQLHSCQRHA